MSDQPLHTRIVAIYAGASERSMVAELRRNLDGTCLIDAGAPSEDTTVSTWNDQVTLAYYPTECLREDCDDGKLANLATYRPAHLIEGSQYAT